MSSFYYGPWLDAPLQTITNWGGLGYWGIDASQVNGPDFAALCAVDGLTGGGEMIYSKDALPSTNYRLGQKTLNLQWAAAPPLYVPPTSPPGAVGIDYEGVSGTPSSVTALSWLRSMAIDVTLLDRSALFGIGTLDDVDIVVVPRHPTELVYPAGTSNPPQRTFMSATNAAARTVAGSASFPAASSSLTLTDVPVDPADIDPLYLWFSLQLVYGQQLGGVAPAADTGRVIRGQYDGVIGAIGGGYSADITYQPPRYRFVYAARPPLAHRQRRDGTATAGPQLAHIGTPGGRPPLAWRQNNP